jgi:hypothetical protein
MYPEPDGKIWFCPVKKLFHPFLHVLLHAIKTGMLEPVLGSVPGKGKSGYAVFSDGLVQVQ